MRVMLAQCCPTVGDVKGNVQMMLNIILRTSTTDCDVVVFPELVTVGYPPRDLLHKDELWKNHDVAVKRINACVKQQKRQITVIFGGLHQSSLTYGRYARHNAAYICDKVHKEPRIVHKTLLPTYDVFDENRYFQPSKHIGPRPTINIYHGIDGKQISRCDVLICEDIWNYQYDCEDSWSGSYATDPVSELTGTGPLFVINGSPYWRGKIDSTYQLIHRIGDGLHRSVVWVNQVGAHDDIVFHGGSMIYCPFSHPRDTYIGRLFAEDIECQLVEDLHGPYHNQKWYEKTCAPSDFDIWCDWHALTLHIKEYCRRTGFEEVVLGLSGGVDSALVCALAAEALGPKCVHGIAMPSRFSSPHSIADAEQLANNLGLGSFEIIHIDQMHETTRRQLLSGGMQEFAYRVTDENLQPRLRMIILMARSNDFGWLLLTTGNKSELSVGYSTLYGDAAGGLAVISDLPKTRVWQMTQAYNKYKGAMIIPESTLTKQPSAELAEGQFDTDTLPPYDQLDVILEMILDDKGEAEIIATLGIEAGLIRRIVKMYEKSEYKRQQMASGPKVTRRAFGSGRRVPISARYQLLPER